MLSLSARYAARIARTGAFHRGYAAAAAEATDAIEMPKAAGTSGRYATALYSAAAKTNSLDAVTEDVSAMIEMQKSTAAFDTFLRNPSLPRSAKVEVLGAVAEKAGFSPTFTNFIKVIAENGRTADSGKILQTFSEMISSQKGEVVLKVTSTTPLSEWEIALLKKNIQERFYDGASAEFTVETAIDHSLLGGLTVQIGDRFMDLSVREELRKIESVIQSTGM